MGSHLTNESNSVEFEREVKHGGHKRKNEINEKPKRENRDLFYITPVVTMRILTQLTYL